MAAAAAAAATTDAAAASAAASIPPALTHAQRHVVAASAPLVAGNIEAIVKQFYATMFANNPTTLAFFNQANQRRGRQPAALARFVLAAVGHLDSLDTLGDAAASVVDKHCALGVLPEHYQIVHDNFLAAVGTVLGGAVTADVADAWSAVLKTLAHHLIGLEAAAYERRTAALDAWDAREAMPFTVRRVHYDEAADITTVHLARADGGAAPSYIPGQYLTLACVPPDADGAVVAPRHYTIAAPAPLDDGTTLRICVRRVRGVGGEPDGVVSSYIATQLRVGARVQVRPPFGHFNVNLFAAYERVAVVTGGVGVTPALAMLQPLAANGRRVAHVHVERNEARVAGANELAVTTTFVYGGAADATPPKLAALLADAGTDICEVGTGVFVCGPPAMITAVCDGFATLGADRSRLHFEAFGPAIA